MSETEPWEKGAHHRILHELWRSFPSSALVLHLRRLELRRSLQYIIEISAGLRPLLPSLLLLSLVLICAKRGT